MKIFSKKSRSGSIKGDREVEEVAAEEQRYVSKNLELNADVQKQKFIDSSKKMIERQLEIQKAFPIRPSSMKAFDESATFFNMRVGELYKFKESGGKVVGTLCIFAPNELILAAGAIPIRLCSGFHEPVFSANELLGEVGLCPLVRSTLGNKMVGSNPYFELCDLVVAPTTCDGKMKLGEILQDYLPVLMLNVPRVKEGYITHNQWMEEIRFFSRKLESLTGNKITGKSLMTAIDQYQRAQKAWFRFMELRNSGKAPSIFGRDALMISQMTAYEDINRWSGNLERLNQELERMVKENKFVGKTDDPRILLAGSPQHLSSSPRIAKSTPAEFSIEMTLLVISLHR